MKKLTTIMLAGLLVLTSAMMLGCGSGSGSGDKAADKGPQPFTLGEYTYLPEKITRAADADTDSAEGYTVSLLIEGDTAPIIISNGVTRAGVEMSLVSGDTELNFKTASFSVLEDKEKVDQYGARAAFTFEIPKGSDFPEKAIASGGDNWSEKAEFSLADLPREE